MEAAAIVESFDVIEDRETCLFSGPEAEVVQALGLEGVEEALRDRVVVAITRAAHAASQTRLIESVLVLGADIGASSVGVV